MFNSLYNFMQKSRALFKYQQKSQLVVATGGVTFYTQPVRVYPSVMCWKLQLRQS